MSNQSQANPNMAIFIWTIALAVKLSYDQLQNSRCLDLKINVTTFITNKNKTKTTLESRWQQLPYI